MNPVQPALTAGVLALAATAPEGNRLWEVGARAGAFPFPDYRSSDQNSRWLLPVPFYTYHGNFYKAGRHATRVMVDD